MQYLYTGQEITIHDQFNLYAFFIHSITLFRESGWEEECDFKTGGKNIINLHYVDDTILVTKSAKDLQALIIKIKEQKIGTKIKQK